MDSDKLVNLDRTLDLTSFRHLCCIYDNVNDYMEVITNIIKNGLDANERIFYSGDFENTDLVLKHLLSKGINVEGLISKGQLGLNVFELKRICNDFVDTAQIISMLDSEVQKAFSMGFKGLRVIGEMSFAKACNFSTSEIIEHEAKIDDFANKKNKSSVFCLFNKNLFPPSIILDILLTQEAICVGTDVYENFISIPKDILLQNNRDEVLLDFWIRNLKERTKIHESYFLDSIIENIPNMIFIKDAKNLRFLKLNKAGEQLLGYSREEFIGKNDYDFFPKEEADFFTSKDRKVLENKVLMDIEEETIHTKNLGTRHLHTKKIPLLNDEGKPLYLLGVSEDITDKLKAQEALELSERKYKAI
ncbi:MAG: MEDS domain-containing protein, partial [Thermodesulfobacteriota bacterium]